MLCNVGSSVYVLCIIVCVVLIDGWLNLLLLWLCLLLIM